MTNILDNPKSSFLFQRARFRKEFDLTKADKFGCFLDFDCMGNADCEFGALSKVRDHMKANAADYCTTVVAHNNVLVGAIVQTDCLEEVKNDIARIFNWRKDNHHFEEDPEWDNYFDASGKPLRKKEDMWDCLISVDRNYILGLSSSVLMLKDLLSGKFEGPKNFSIGDSVSTYVWNKDTQCYQPCTARVVGLFDKEGEDGANQDWVALKQILCSLPEIVSGHKYRMPAYLVTK